MYNIATLLVHNKSKLLAETYTPWITRNSSVLDVGCGNGIVSQHLADHFSLRVTGCDVKQYLLRPIIYVHMNRESELPFKSSAFDTIMFNDALHHTRKENQIHLLEEAVRVAKKNILIFEALPTLSTYVFDYLMNRLSQPLVDVPLTFRTKKEWNDVFHTLPVRVTVTVVPRPWFSPFPHIAFELKKEKKRNGL